MNCAAQPPERIRFEIRRHVIELVRVRDNSYAAELDGKRGSFTVTDEWHDGRGDKNVKESVCDVADLTTLLELREADAHVSSNPMWIEMSAGAEHSWWESGSSDQFVILLDDDGLVWIILRHYVHDAAQSYY